MPLIFRCVVFLLHDIFCDTRSLIADFYLLACKVNAIIWVSSSYWVFLKKGAACDRLSAPTNGCSARCDWYPSVLDRWGRSIRVRSCCRCNSSEIAHSLCCRWMFLRWVGGRGLSVGPAMRWSSGEPGPFATKAPGMTLNADGWVASECETVWE